MSLSLGVSSFLHWPPTKWRVVSYRSPIYAHSQPPQSFKRRSANFKPTMWHDNFIQSLSCGPKLDQIENAKRICNLKKEVSGMIYKEEPLKDKLELVDALQQLGIAYHFKEEINCVLTAIHNSKVQDLSATMNDDIYLVSLLFRLLRTNGFSVSEDIFRNYFDDEGNCKPKLSLDIKGMLSLYEASYLAKEGEEMLEIARHFTTKHLRNYLESSKYNIDQRMKEHVSHSLELPLHWRMEILHIRWFIDQYKTCEKTRHALWELAVLDFNLNQNLWKEELKQVSRWWTGLRLYENLPYFRDRLVENYFVVVGGAFEPEESKFRIAQTQANCLLTTVDDTYDVYGSLDELEAFTKAIDQWDISATKALPEYMQLILSAIFDSVENLANGVLERKGLNVSPILRRAWKEFCTASLVQARWYHDGYVPTLEEYLDNGWVSVGAHSIISNAYCINDHVTAKDLEQYSSGYPDKVRYSSVICRLYNDLGTSDDEVKRGDNSKSIQCYMHHKKVTESVARQKIKDLILKYWKLLNGENVGDSAFDKYFRDAVLDVPRMCQFLYQDNDRYGSPDDTKELITLLLLKPIK